MADFAIAEPRLDMQTVVRGYPKDTLVFALSWALAAMTESFIDLNYEDYKDPTAGEDAEAARDILRQVYEDLGGNDDLSKEQA